MASPGIFYLKNAIRKEMPSRVKQADTNQLQVDSDFHWQLATFDNPDAATLSF